jgi:predicted membrane protein
VTFYVNIFNCHLCCGNVASTIWTDRTSLFNLLVIVSSSEEQKVNLKKRTAILGFVFILLLLPAYLENSSFFRISGDIFLNPLLAILFIFVHNVLVISLILLGMTFYVGLVLTFMPKRKIEYVVLNNPRIFAIVLHHNDYPIKHPQSKHTNLRTSLHEHTSYSHST